MYTYSRTKFRTIERDREEEDAYVYARWERKGGRYKSGKKKEKRENNVGRGCARVDRDEISTRGVTISMS